MYSDALRQRRGAWPCCAVLRWVKRVWRMAEWSEDRRRDPQESRRASMSTDVNLVSDHFSVIAIRKRDGCGYPRAHGSHAGDATDIDKARLHLPLVSPICHLSGPKVTTPIQSCP
jgi:hypothetical protein